MKKTLLCFLLLFTTIFYAQGSLTVCAGQTFNLNAYKSVIIGNSNITEANISYHLSPSDAMNNTNAITNLSNYKINSSPQTIYTRVEDSAVFSVLTLSEVPALDISASNKPILCKGDTASLSINVSGGSGSYQYSLNDGPLTNDSYYSYLPGGIYKIKVVDIATGCAASINYTIIEPDLVTATSTIANQNVLIVTATGGTSPYRYSLDGVDYQSSNVFTGKAPGTYVIRVSDSEGCGAEVRATILSPLATDAYIVKELDCIGNGTAIINIDATGGQAPYSYSINGATYQASNILNNLNAGTYSITVRDALNSVSNPYAITIAPLVAVNGVALASNATSCSNASIIVMATSGQAPFYYSIDNGQTFITNNTFNNLTPGNYNFFIKDSKGCVSPSLFNTIQPIAPLVATATNTPLTCATSKTSLTITATGGQLPYQYAINNGTYTNNNTYTDISPGTYHINVKEGNGCISSFAYVITPPNPIYADFIIEGQNLTINGQNGTVPYEYSVDSMPYQFGNVYTNLEPGHHRVLIKDAKGCESNTFMVLIEEPNALSASATLIKEVDCVSNATIEIIALGGKEPYQYSINGGQTYQSSAVFNNLISGPYSPSVKDASDFILYTNPITISAPINLIAEITKATTCGENDTVTLTASGGKAPYSYSFNGSTFSAANSFNGLSAGIHTLSVKDSNGCQAAIAVTIEPIYSLVSNIMKTDAHCFKDNSGSITIMANGGKIPYSYSINNSEYVTTNTFSNLSAGQYMINVKDATGCTNSYAMSISEPNILSLTTNATHSTTIADNDGKITVITTGGVAPYSYAITTNGNVPNTVFQSSPIFTGLKAGSYDIQVKDAMGCINMQTNISILNNVNTLLATTIVAAPTCVNPLGVITVTATGGTLPYQYSADGGITFTSSNIFSDLLPGTYSIVVQDSFGFISQIDSVVLPYIPATIIANVTYKTSNDPVSGEITVSSSGGTAPYKYTIINTATGLIVYENMTATVYSELAAGIYSITAKDANGCESEKKEVTITPAVPLLITAVNAPVSCMNSTILTINASGGIAPYSYRIFSSLPYTTNNIFTDVEPDTYFIEVKDAAGNKGEISYTVLPNIALKINLTKKDVTCYGIKDGSITATTTGGIAPYTYSLNNGTFSSSNVFTFLTAGNYRITVKDAAGCLTSSSLTIERPDPLTLSGTVINATTSTSNDGQVIAVASGGTLPYTYTLRDRNGFYAKAPQIFNIFSNVEAGSYQLQMTDAKQCEYLVYEITVGTTTPTFSATTEVIPISCTAGSITVNATGGIAPYQYSEDGVHFNSSNVFSVLSEGLYNIYVQDATSTTISLETIIIKQETTLSIDVNPSSELYCHGDNSGKMYLTIENGKSPYYVSLDNAPYINFGDSWAGTFHNLSAGNHTIAVKDAYGCIATATTIVTEPATALITTVKVENQTVSITATGGTAPYKYAISPNLDTFSANNVFSQLTPASYTIIISDLKGCLVKMDVVVDPPAPLIEGKNKLTIEFKPGQTLADLIIEGQNIKWYTNMIPSTGKTTKTNETPLPLTTILVDGTTYYASQTINGIESTERLAVTAKSNGTLSTSDFMLPNFKYYPNPVLHNLTIENSSIIDEIEIFSVSGQTILFKAINNNRSDIDLSNISSGFYFLKVKSEGLIKIIKIVKK